MPGPAPKEPESRRRRNVPASGEWVTLPSEPYTGPRPNMPALDAEDAVATWELWWRSPMAHMWTEGDWPGLCRLIVLIDQGVDVEYMKEIRMQEDRFGLSPKGRQALHWRFVPGEPEPVAPAAKSKSKARYAHLKVVDEADALARS